MTTIDEYLEAQRAEWGRYVAKEPIFVDGVRAFNAGDPVPVSHVESGVVTSEQVVGAQVDEPKGNAPLEEWQNFARTRGATDEELASASRDDLRGSYSTKEG
jgi:hypothetical protein